MIKSILSSFLLIGLITVFMFVQSCDSNATTDTSIKENKTVSSEKKLFKNIQAKMFYPTQLLQTENAYNYSFTNSGEDVFYVVSVYVGQNGDQVQQIINEQIKSSQMPLTIINNFKKENNGLIVADINANLSNGSFPGYLIINQLENGNTYLLYTVAANKNNLQQQKIDVEKMALSIEPNAQQNSSIQSNAGTNSQPKSVEEYEQFLKGKVLIFSNHKKSTISGEDNTASHGVATYYEDVEKIKRFVFCNGGFSYFRFISKGEQLTGDNGIIILDKFSGHWKVISENNQIFIHIQDERDNRYRTWKINEINNNMISIDGIIYTIFPEDGSECTELGLKVPD